MRALGYAGPWAVEVFSEELSQRAFYTTIAQFDEA
jgi:hypothetical protein